MSNAPAPAARHAAILFAHGARDPAWALPFEAVASALREHDAQLRVELAYLEFMQPDLPTAGALLAAAGCRHIHVIPLFLGTGGHVRRDLPVMLDALRQQHPLVAWTLTPAIGECGIVIRAMAQAAADLTRATSAAAQT